MEVTIIPVGTLGTNCYMLSSQSGLAVLIDPGSQPEKIAGILDSRELTLTAILLTHGHWDHTGAVKGLLGIYPKANCYVGRHDKELLCDKAKFEAIGRTLDWEDYHLPNAKELKDGESLELDELVITVIETPGHSLGSVCYLCGDVIFSGDTLFYENIGRCDFYGGDFDSIKKSLAKLANLPGDYTVYPGHGEPTTLNHERAHNPYISRK